MQLIITQEVLVTSASIDLSMLKFKNNIFNKYPARLLIVFAHRVTTTSFNYTFNYNPELE